MFEGFEFNPSKKSKLSDIKSVTQENITINNVNNTNGKKLDIQSNLLYPENKTINTTNDIKIKETFISNDIAITDINNFDPNKKIRLNNFETEQGYLDIPNLDDTLENTSNELDEYDNPNTINFEQLSNELNNNISNINIEKNEEINNKLLEITNQININQDEIIKEQNISNALVRASTEENISLETKNKEQDILRSSKEQDIQKINITKETQINLYQQNNLYPLNTMNTYNTKSFIQGNLLTISITNAINEGDFDKAEKLMNLQERFLNTQEKTITIIKKSFDLEKQQISLERERELAKYQLKKINLIHENELYNIQLNISEEKEIMEYNRKRKNESNYNTLLVKCLSADEYRDFCYGIFSKQSSPFIIPLKRKNYLFNKHRSYYYVKAETIRKEYETYFNATFTTKYPLFKNETDEKKAYSAHGYCELTIEWTPYQNATRSSEKYTSKIKDLTDGFIKTDKNGIINLEEVKKALFTSTIRKFGYSYINTTGPSRQSRYRYILPEDYEHLL